MIISDTLDRTLGDKRHVVTVELAVHALMESSTSCDVTFEEEVKTQLPAVVREAVENGVQSAYLQGNRNGCFRAFMPETSKCYWYSIVVYKCGVFVSHMLLVNQLPFQVLC